VHRVGEVGGQRADGGDGGGLVVGVVEDALDEGAADDDPVGEGRDLGGLLPVGDPQADTDRQGGAGTGAFHQVCGLAADRLAGAGDAHQGGGVDEAGAGR